VSALGRRARGTLVARLRTVPPRRINVGGILTRHAHVAAQRQGTHAIVCWAALPAEQAWPETDREHVYAHAEHPRRDEVPPLVHQNQYAKHESDAKQQIQSHTIRVSLLCRPGPSRVQAW